MARHRFVVEGIVESPLTMDSPLLAASAAGVQVLFAAEMATAARAAAAGMQPTPALADDDLVEIALEGGGHLWMSVGEFETSDLVDLQATRAGGPLRIRACLAAPAQARGLGDALIRALRFFRIELPDSLAKAGKRRLVEAIEDTLGMPPGLYRLDDDADHPALLPLGERARFDTQPYLLLLHGANSSTQGSFGDLWHADGGAAIRTLRTRYGRGHLLALQHRTLSESPVDNALAVAKTIPAGVRLHLLTHSRGGLVAELLARATVAKGEAPFDAAEIAAYRAATSVAAANTLRELGTVLARRRPAIERCVRVACPARGTTLASGKLARWCNLLLNLVDARVGAVGDGMAGALFLLLKATIKQLVDVEDLPGLAAMNPGSALVRLLNGGTRTVSADLAIIAADTEGGGWLQRLGLLLVDAFFERDNDLVVDTVSMRGGARRTGDVHEYRLRAADIHHLAYFRHALTRERLLRALCEDDPGRRHADFEVVAMEAPPAARDRVPLRAVTRSRAAHPPIVYLLPGIMGTHLRVKDDRVWLNYLRLVLGDFRRLEITRRQVEPDGLDGDTYADLVDFLARTHEVVPFGYDWRLSVEDAAQRLNRALHEKLATIDRARQPIRLIAHSMGGLVARAMMQRPDSAWPALCEHAGARLLMLGTPNAGSHAITQLLFGEEKLVRMLATFDLRHGLDDLVGQIGAFPGVLDLLPADGEHTWFDAATWNELARRALPRGWPTPTAAALERARAWRDGLAAQVLDPARVFYVAGQADATAVEVDVETRRQGERLRFRTSAAGDGRVPWDGGIPAGVRAWFTDAVHGDLAAHRRAHPAYLDLLERGDTRALSQERPQRGARAGTTTDAMHWAAPATEVASLPTADAVSRAAAARATAAVHADAQPTRLPVRVAWGDLRHARHAVMVGHYAGDSLISAEAALDRALGGRLSRPHRLGLYPGAIGTALAILDEGAAPKGVVVVGLGAIGRLSPGELGDAVARGVVEWIDVRDETRRRDGDAIARGGLSLLMIGSGEGGVDADTAVFSILRGVREGLERGRRAGLAITLETIEFVELYQDRAHRLWHALDRLLAQGELRSWFVLDGPLAAIGEGRTRLWEAAPAGWWRRLQVSHESGAGDGMLAFTRLTDSARSETTRIPYEAALLDALVARSIARTDRDETLEKALFELLLPNAIKERAPQREALVLLLDRSSANLPWELLSDPFGRDATDADAARPLAVRAGLVRQFATLDFRARPSLVVDNTALVIGDPPGPSEAFGDLPGARREARAVAEALRANARFRVEHLDQPNGEAVVQALMPTPWRILHVASHGMLADAALDRDAGIVLDAFNLTWAALDQMRAVPEIVFINSCHLGRVAEHAHDDALARGNRYAAGVGEVFIRHGARAVIAAGWAVEDGAAEAFARMFYTQMLAGERFGEAVRLAREAAYEEAPLANTWGAYQCYGDPDYRLIGAGADAATAATAVRYASIEELVTAAIDTLAVDGANDEAARHDVRLRIEALLHDHADLATRDDARIALALARAWARAGHIDEALAAYERARRLDPGRLDLADCERHATLVLQGATRAAASPRALRAARRSVEQALAAGIALLALAPTRARHVLLGETWKAAARLRRGEGRRRALRSAQIAYEAAASMPASETTVADAAHAHLLAALVGALGRRRAKAATGPDRQASASASKRGSRHAFDLFAEAVTRGTLDARQAKRLTLAFSTTDEYTRSTASDSLRFLDEAEAPGARALAKTLRDAISRA